MGKSKELNEKRKLIKEIDTVEKWMEWRFGNYESAEDFNRGFSAELGWEITDVLYSFLAIYAIGMLSFYPNKYHRTDYAIRDTVTNTNVYSGEFIKKHYKECKELNLFIEKSGFITNYFKIGNIYPMWPGGNKDKGTTWNFDLPEIYFNKEENKIWFQILKEVYKNACLDEVTNLEWSCDDKGEYINGLHMFEFKNAKLFLDSIDAENYLEDVRRFNYQHFLENRVVRIIQKRTRLLSKSSPKV